MIAPEGWIETTGTVTFCRFRSPGLSTLAFGFQTTRRFRISFDYYAHGRLYSAEFGSDVAIPQNETIPVFYNPLKPEENNRASPQAGSDAGLSRSPMIAVGIAGSIVLSLAWLLVLRGCH